MKSAVSFDSSSSFKVTIKSSKTFKSSKSFKSLNTLEPGFHSHDYFQTILSYLKTSMDVENSSDVKDSINKYLINPTPSKSFKRNRAYDANKHHLQTPSSRPTKVGSLKQELTSQNKRKVLRNLHIKTVRFEMTSETQKLGY